MADEYIRRLNITGPESSRTVDVPVGVLTIGRQAGNDIRLNHAMVSRRHATIECSAEACQITDLGSANGTTVNGQALKGNSPVSLGAKAKIEIGPFQLDFEQVAIVAPEPPPPEPKSIEPDPEPEPPEIEPPPPVIPPLPPRPPDREPPDYSQPPPGLSHSSSRYLEYLPGIYQTDFMARFLAIFESIMSPVEWNVDNFDLYLNPNTTPAGFLSWLANWFSISFDPSWSEQQQRTLLTEAHEIFARRGTRWALSRVLEIYTGVEPEIVDLQEGEDPFTFVVKLPLTKQEADRSLIERIIDVNKPSHTNYKLSFKRRQSSKRRTTSKN
jgi:phage tail-like protein